MQIELDLVDQYNPGYLVKSLVWLGQLESPSEVGKQYQIDSLPTGELIDMDVVTARFRHIKTGMCSGGVKTDRLKFVHCFYQLAYGLQLGISVARSLIAVNPGFLSISPVPPIAEV